PIYRGKDGRALDPRRVATQQREPVRRLVLAEAAREGFEPVLAAMVWQRRREKIADRAGALSGEVGEIDAQELPRDEIGGVVGPVMHVLHDRVGLQHQLLAGLDAEHRDVVGEPRGTRPRERREIPPDALELAEPLHRANSVSRSCRATRSSTPFTSAGSLPPKKA